VRRRSATVLVCALGLAALGLTGSGSSALLQPGHPGDGRGAVVLVSGRDDHGLVTDPEVVLLGAPDGGKPAGRIPDGHFARVIEVRGTWLHVKSLDGPTVDGWLDDFFLRDRAVLDGEEQVRLLDARSAGGTLQIYVRSVTDPSAPPIWADADRLAEVLAPPSD
jgi:hypothetical protein